MSARVKKIRHDENTRAKIQVAKIIGRLEGLVAGTVEMPPHAVTAALGLLRKVLPDVNSVEITAEITTTKVIRTPMISTDIDTWQKQYTDQPKPTELN
jgi:hypothetical protein